MYKESVHLNQALPYQDISIKICRYTFIRRLEQTALTEIIERPSGQDYVIGSRSGKGFDCITKLLKLLSLCDWLDIILTSTMGDEGS